MARVGRRRGDGLQRAVVAGGRGLLRALDLTVRSAGHEHVPATGPVVLAANHVSFPDFVFVQQALLAGPAGSGGRLARFLCRHEIWGVPVVGAAMDRMRQVPVDRAAPAAAYLRARALLREAEAVCVFPEAGISAAYVVRALMPGAVALARETGAPLVPVSVWGGQRLWPQKRTLEDPFPRPTPARGRLVDVVFHPPLAEPTTEALGHVLQAGLETLQRLPEHRPRPGEWAPWHPAHLGGDAVPRAESFALDGLPRAAIAPTWGPGPPADGDA
ncbi:1-acyl-sn-glycerol-3-phosphate acyltransferase [Nocardioides flavescens]|uniref:1-acyl-sn-glycerol-3-phosphate acyltransferase n=1 Tax=Nocardioides flavescens TaxID=2691959 RepID=A0A6L7EWR6_9ACTN|nr:1-acyl-sn-glycerol-3-phosphate acyltransferase [Nocardioides flavescens]